MIMRLDQLIEVLEWARDEHGDEWMVAVTPKERRVILDRGEVMSISGIRVEVMPDESRVVYLIGEEY